MSEVDHLPRGRVEGEGVIIAGRKYLLPVPVSSNTSAVWYSMGE